MNIIRAKDYEEMSRRAADILAAQIILKPDCVLGLATGSTPLGVYARLIDRYNRGDLDFSRVSTVNLDEYRGRPAPWPARPTRRSYADWAALTCNCWDWGTMATLALTSRGRSLRKKPIL